MNAIDLKLNILDSVMPDAPNTEKFDILFEIPGLLKLERIHSNDACSAEGFWYD
jgi:hypothetical protein